MINKDFYKLAEEDAESRGFNVDEVLACMERALIMAFKKEHGNTSCRVEFRKDKNEILLYSIHKVVEEYTNYSKQAEEELTEEIEKPQEEVKEEPTEPQYAEMLLEDAKKIKSNYKVGDLVLQPENLKTYSRMTILAAGNMYKQGVRTLEREKAYLYFKDFENEMITAEVSNVGDKFLTLKLGFNVTSILAVSDLLPNDHFEIGDFIKVYVKKVEQTTKEPKVVVSRTERNLVTRLLENYIPEIKNGIIEIKGIARDPGDRTKIAIYSNDERVDAIGSCVGEGGSRIREIVNALGGEKVDLYKWSENPEELIANSLQPASVTKVLSIDPKTKSSQVVVPDDHLSLAIGKSGQNVRLAVQSCGWKIDIMPTSKAYEKGLIQILGL
ncbi:MAG: transcription termination factor NusA [Anaeroplasma bactoclasticum]|nr:transcription termination factor NusA [Anaeroplasma bactoclasticum]MCM1557353.1 transcription termination factor NusA [Anaeroplasma bactoclasticum]